MAYNLSGFDANQEDDVSFDPVPAGIYSACITASEEVPTKAGTGSMLKLTLEIQDGAYQGKKLWVRLNLDNPNEQAVRIARSELAKICRAVGVPNPEDAEDLHDIPFQVKAIMKPRADNGELSNEVKGYWPEGGEIPESALIGLPGYKPSKVAAPVRQPAKPAPATAPVAAGEPSADKLAGKRVPWAKGKDQPAS